MKVSVEAFTKVTPKPAKPATPVPPPPLSFAMLRPGLRLAVGVSGGVDSVGLLRVLALEQARLGLVLTVAHMHHRIRGLPADEDARFVQELSTAQGLRFLRRDADTPAVAQGARANLEETARVLRYSWFSELVASGMCDAVATAHTQNDQAETVLGKLLRGAWTEGLAGIYPEAAPAYARQAGAGEGPVAAGGPVLRTVLGPVLRPVLRPFLGATREQIVAWLEALGQPWREDATNADLGYTRNRIRHRLLPELATYNPRIVGQLAQVAEIAREEEDWWQAEVGRLLPGLLLPGRAVRGGGRASSTLPGERSLAIEVERLRSLHPALVRRLLRGTARELGVSLDFEQTARLVGLVHARGTANPGREDLTSELRAERTPRELRLLLHHETQASAGPGTMLVEIPVPGEGNGFGWRIQVACVPVTDPNEVRPAALLRVALPGDRVQLRNSRGAPKRIKEVLERMGVPAADRGGWPVLEWHGEIVWMRGAVLEPTAVSAKLRVEADAIP